MLFSAPRRSVCGGGGLMLFTQHRLTDLGDASGPSYEPERHGC